MEGSVVKQYTSPCFTKDETPLASHSDLGFCLLPSPQHDCQACLAALNIQDYVMLCRSRQWQTSWASLSSQLALTPSGLLRMSPSCPRTDTGQPTVGSAEIPEHGCSTARLAVQVAITTLSVFVCMRLRCQLTCLVEARLWCDGVQAVIGGSEG